MKRPWWLEDGVDLQGTEVAAVEIGAGRMQTQAAVLTRVLNPNEKAEVMDEEDRNRHWLRKRIRRTRKARCSGVCHVIVYGICFLIVQTVGRI